jgi:hypothetical protein
MSEESDRKAFEEWIMTTKRDYSPAPLSVWITNNNRYRNEAVQLAWEAWQEVRSRLNESEGN